MKRYAEIENANMNVSDMEDNYLQSYGWKMSCNYPGAFWLWSRDFSAEDAERYDRWVARGPGPLGMPSEPRPYGVVAVPKDVAIRMTLSDLEPPIDASENEDDEP